MYPVAFQQSTQTKVIPFQGETGVVLTHIKLNYHEVVCIEIALIGLTECIRNNTLPDILAGFRLNFLSAQVTYLRHWLHKPALKLQLCSDGSNYVWWPLTSSELVDWLFRICQSCISEDAILIAAADAASYEYTEFSNFYVENNECYSLADDMMYRNFSAFQDYYNDIIISCQATLVGKLGLIQEQDYPLFPEYAISN